MRLIDADALREARSYGQGTSGDDFMRPFYWADDIDAAPAVRCEECKHDRYPGMSCRIMGAGSDGCDHFERRAT